MKFNDIPTEQSTAVTNVLVALALIAIIIYLNRIGAKDRWKANIWIATCAFLCLSVSVGAVVHGLQISAGLYMRLWQIIYLSLGLMMALFVVGVLYDLWGVQTAKRFLPIMIVVGFAFFCLTLIWPDNFMVFNLFQAVAMLFSLSGYVGLAVRKKAQGAWLMSIGIVTLITAAVVQATKAVSFTFILPFNHNGAYHLIALVGVTLIAFGIRKSLLAQ